MRLSCSSRLIGVLAAATVLSAGLAGCGGGNSGGNAASGGDSGKIQAVASTDVWGSVLSAVGGDQVQVTSIVHDPGADPHSYETTPKDALAAQDAQVTLGNGGGYDDFFTQLADQASNARKLTACNIGAIGTALNCDENEHVWYSFETVEKVADQAAAEFGQLRPSAAQTFTANATEFKVKVDILRQQTEQAGAVHPGAKVLATEPVAHYLLQTAKITDTTPHEFSEAVEEESDVPPAALEEVNALVSGKQVKAVVNNAQTVTPVTRQVVDNAKKAGLPVVDVTETLPAGATDYVSWMTGEVNALAGALNS